MSEKSLSIKIRRARKELRIMQDAASIIYHKLSAINNIDRGKTSHFYRSVYIESIESSLGEYQVKSITELEKLIRKQKSKIRKYDQRICKLQSTQNMK